MSGIKVTLRTIKAALVQFGTLNNSRRHKCSQTQDMGVAVDWNTVQSEQVVAGATAAHIHGGSAVCACGYPGKPLHPVDGVALAYGR